MVTQNSHDIQAGNNYYDVDPDSDNDNSLQHRHHIGRNRWLLQGLEKIREKMSAAFALREEHLRAIPARTAASVEERVALVNLTRADAAAAGALIEDVFSHLEQEHWRKDGQDPAPTLEQLSQWPLTGSLRATEFTPYERSLRDLLLQSGDRLCFENHNYLEYSRKQMDDENVFDPRHPRHQANLARNQEADRLRLSTFPRPLRYQFGNVLGLNGAVLIGGAAAGPGLGAAAVGAAASASAGGVGAVVGAAGNTSTMAAQLAAAGAGGMGAGVYQQQQHLVQGSAALGGGPLHRGEMNNTSGGPPAPQQGGGAAGNNGSMMLNSTAIPIRRSTSHESCLDDVRPEDSCTSIGGQLHKAGFLGAGAHYHGGRGGGNHDPPFQHPRGGGNPNLYDGGHLHLQGGYTPYNINHQHPGALNANARVPPASINQAAPGFLSQQGAPIQLQQLPTHQQMMPHPQTPPQNNVFNMPQQQAHHLQQQHQHQGHNLQQPQQMPFMMEGAPYSQMMQMHGAGAGCTTTQAPLNLNCAAPAGPGGTNAGTAALLGMQHQAQLIHRAALAAAQQHHQQQQHQQLQAAASQQFNNGLVHHAANMVQLQQMQAQLHQQQAGTTTPAAAVGQQSFVLSSLDHLNGVARTTSTTDLTGNQHVVSHLVAGAGGSALSNGQHQHLQLLASGGINNGGGAGVGASTTGGPGAPVLLPKFGEFVLQGEHQQDELQQQQQPSATGGWAAIIWALPPAGARLQEEGWRRTRSS
eukprot:g12926.t1